MTIATTDAGCVTIDGSEAALDNAARAIFRCAKTARGRLRLFRRKHSFLIIQEGWRSTNLDEANKTRVDLCFCDPKSDDHTQMIIDGLHDRLCSRLEELFKKQWFEVKIEPYMIKDAGNGRSYGQARALQVTISRS